jgi:hypothetical protein
LPIRPSSAGDWPDNPATLTLFRDRATIDQHGEVCQTALQGITAKWPDEPATLTWQRDRTTTDADGDVST